LVTDRGVVSIGEPKIRSSDDCNDFAQYILLMHVFGGVGWITRLLRDVPTITPGCERMAAEIGLGDSRYAAYERAIAAPARDWLIEALQSG
jgi:hypothetical protein